MQQVHAQTGASGDVGLRLEDQPCLLVEHADEFVTHFDEVVQTAAAPTVDISNRTKRHRQ